MEKWFDVPEKEGSSVICSRVRLVRNWREYPFPGKMTKEQSVEMTGRLMNGVKESGAFSGSRSRYLYLDRIPDLERTALLERRAISRGVSKKKAAAGLVLSEDERLGITINGDDHIRIHAVEKGAALTECYRRADQMEELLGSRFEYSFDEKYGYLTSFPTSVGTGLRASVVLHLPALSRRKNFNSLTSDMGRFGTLVRGLYGEGEENPGSLYQISNQKTLGQTEKEIVDLVAKAAAELDAQERRLRRTAMGQRPVACADEAYKSYGVLKYARRLTRKDAMEFLSQIMAGAADGILKMKEPCSVYGLMLGIQPANLLSQAERPLSREELDAARADFLRARLPEII